MFSSEESHAAMLRHRHLLAGDLLSSQGHSGLGLSLLWGPPMSLIYLGAWSFFQAIHTKDELEFSKLYTFSLRDALAPLLHSRLHLNSDVHPEHSTY